MFAKVDTFGLTGLNAFSVTVESSTEKGTPDFRITGLGDASIQESRQRVIAAMENVRKVRGEVHLFSGFLRFSEGANGVFYAPFEPDNDILELLVPHFLARLRCQPFIIHDVKRQTAALYNTTELVFTRTDQKVSVSLSDAEEDFQRLWKEYYRSVNIAERPHEKQMKGYMPVRYWKYMPEKREEN